MKMFIMMMAVAAMMAGCDEAKAEVTEDTPTDFAIQYTTPVPSEFFQATAHQGAIELLEYDSKDYTQSSINDGMSQIYTLDGRQLSTSQKGKNIINGKKMITK